MTISRNFLLATLTFSMLGSLATQDLVAMKRKLDNGIENKDATNDEKLQELRERIRNMCFFDRRNDYNSDLAKLCITPGLDLSDWTFCTILSLAIKNDDLEVVQMLFNAPSISPDVFAQEFEFNEYYGSSVFFMALRRQYDCSAAIVKMLLNHPCTTVEVVKYAFEQTKSHLPSCKMFLNDPRITIEDVNKLLCTKYVDSDVIRELITLDGITADTINQAFSNYIENFDWNSPEVFKILLTHDGVTTNTINRAFARLYGWSGETGKKARKISRLLTADYRFTDEGIKKALKTYAKYRLREREGKIGIQNCIETGYIDQALLHAITYNKPELIELLLLDNRISEEGIDIASVYAAAKSNREAFDLLCADPRVINKSPFPLEDLINNDKIWDLVKYLSNGDFQALRCLNHQSNYLLNQ